MIFLVVGDPHFSHIPPSSRKDDIIVTQFRKLSFIKEVLEKNTYDFMIFLGDIFSRKDVSYFFLNELFSKLFELKFLIPEKKLYFIAGNHDISFREVDSYKYNPLGILERSGVFTYVPEYK